MYFLRYLSVISVSGKVSGIYIRGITATNKKKLARENAVTV
jgi:hypothetical protein